MMHQERREKSYWGSYGKNGDEPLKKILIKDISNDHLENIIIFIRDSQVGITYSMETYNLMLAEKKYRKDNNIFVPDYYPQINKRFIKGLKF